MPFTQGLTRAQGDPGFFGTLGRIAGGVARFAGRIAGIAAPSAPAPPVFTPLQQQRQEVTQVGPGGLIFRRERMVPTTGRVSCPPGP
ncbi:MAG TPA: hypothetical protein VE173_01405, partial [Longimicrobiales bacterium]|nr:hypothetical protein [Longimicrobiales bacterium]